MQIGNNITLMWLIPIPFNIALRIAPGPLQRDPLQQYTLEGIPKMPYMVDDKEPVLYFKHWEYTIAFCDTMDALDNTIVIQPS